MVFSPFIGVSCHSERPLGVLVTEERLIAFDTRSGKVTHSKVIPSLNEKLEEAVEERKPEDALKPIKTLALSHNGCLLATSGDDKILRIWDTASWNVKNVRRLPKRANAIMFDLGDQNILECDKFGDVYSFNVNTTSNEEKLILGHVSMTCDLALSPDEKYVITADRDEHIRISHYPNGYNIETFCLGHTDVVTSIHLLPWNAQQLVSGAGDCTVRLWEYAKGCLIQSLDIEHDIKDAFIPTFAVDSGDAPLITKCISCAQNRRIAVLLARTKKIVLLEYKEAYAEAPLAIAQVIDMGYFSLDAAFDSAGRLWVTISPQDGNDNPHVAVFEWTGSAYQRLPPSHAMLSEINALPLKEVENLNDLDNVFTLRKTVDMDEFKERDELRKAGKDPKALKGVVRPSPKRRRLGLDDVAPASPAQDSTESAE